MFVRVELCAGGGAQRPVRMFLRRRLLPRSSREFQSCVIQLHTHTHTHTHTRPFNGPLSGTAQVSRYQKGKTNLDFAEARDSEWQ